MRKNTCPVCRGVFRELTDEEKEENAREQLNEEMHELFPSSREFRLVAAFRGENRGELHLLFEDSNGDRLMITLRPTN